MLVESGAISEADAACQAVIRTAASTVMLVQRHIAITLAAVNTSLPFQHRPAVGVALPPVARARFGVGDVVRHRLFDFRGVIFDIDPVFANSDEWYESIPADIRPDRNQPFYHLLAENAESSYVAYVSQQNLVTDSIAGPVDHPAIDDLFEDFSDGRYRLRSRHRH